MVSRNTLWVQLDKKLLEAAHKYYIPKKNAGRNTLWVQLDKKWSENGDHFSLNKSQYSMSAIR